jgi:hypothetical protein
VDAHLLDQLVVVHFQVVAWGLREACQDNGDHCGGGHIHGEGNEFFWHAWFIQDVLTTPERMLAEFDLIHRFTESCQIPQDIFSDLKINFALALFFSYK